ncbi:MAG: N-acyl-D-amino-acid deacylase family protein [Pseudomonas sp.]|uniref:N-acyl-D-amino-acid deacylase family protein n=1 Tax=Pseudomonas sp. TaxID=306 RepID=UPI003D0C8157
MNYDLVIRNGIVFDGVNENGVKADVAIKAGKIAAVGTNITEDRNCQNVIDAKGCWVMPGFLEMHSHYDAEILTSAALKESIRHGVTTVATGLCSLSMVAASAEDCADLFSRVESIPHDHVLSLLKEKKQWSTPSEYRSFLEDLPLGPNVACYIGHSDIRSAAMGLLDATTERTPSEAEMRHMETLLNDALDNGFLGLSVMKTKIDRVAGERAWSRPLPSTFASWKEFKRLFATLRKRGAILQGAPDVAEPSSAVRLMFATAGWFRPKLKTTLLTALDLKVAPLLHMQARLSGWISNWLLQGNLKWQFLPAPLRVYSAGLNFNNFDEFSGGLILRNFQNEADQYAEAAKPEFRQVFKRDIQSGSKIGLWHRDFSDAYIVACPDQSLIGKNFAEVATQRGQDPVDCFLDLAVTYKTDLVWTVLMGNNREGVMRTLIRSPNVHVGFADSGAHIRGLAFYNFPLRLLKYVHDAERTGKSFMSTGAAVARVTSELANWYGLDAGHLYVGSRADIAIIDPSGLDESLDQVAEACIENTSLMRLVNRNDRAVLATLVNGRVAYSRDEGYAEDLGHSQSYGRFLPAHRTCA